MTDEVFGGWIDKQVLERWIDEYMNKELYEMKNPKGFSNVTDKKLPVYVGAGIDRYTIGWAEREILADGMVVIAISINNPDWSEWSVAGFHPLRLRGLIPPVLERKVMTASNDDIEKEIGQALEEEEGPNIAEATRKAQEALEERRRSNG
jgi:hypothetical protein